MSGFEAVREQIDKDLSERSSQSDESREVKETNESQSEPDTREARQSAKAAEAIFDLEKAEKFRFDGQDMTLKELKAMVMRQKDYTQKTQTLAEERKALESQRDSEKNFSDNLVIDLENVRKNPALAQEFIRIYPEKYHGYLKQILSSTSGASQSQGQSSQPQIPVELMSQVQRLQTFVHGQEVAKAETEIESNLTKVLGQYKYASRKEVLADAFELHNRGEKLTADLWEKLAQDSHNGRKGEFDTYYKDLVKQQTQANSKARDVGPGGSTPGQAPKQKFDAKRGFGALNKDVMAQIQSERE